LAPLAAAAPSRPPQAAPTQDQAAKDLDTLYARLARTRYPDEAAGIIAQIDHLRMQSGSDVADLLLGRALKARAIEDWSLTLKLMDAVVDLYPAWSQAWSQRATARLQSGDLDGAMADLAQALKREPRDLGALLGLGALMLNAGDPEAALKVYDRALKLAPAYEPLKEARARAQTKLWSLSP
jgi:tetratricopeptide (TPR) repeat protein